MNVNPYIFFDGRCEDAANFYATALGGEVGIIHRFGAGASTNPEAIQHTDVSVDGKVILQMSDAPAKAPYSGFSISLVVQTIEEARTLFDNLAAEGVVSVPLAASFFSPGFGLLTDKFGVNWFITVKA